MMRILSRRPCATTLAATEAPLTVGAPLGLDRRRNAGAGHERRADRDALAFAEQQHLVERDRGADIGFELLHTQGLALHDAVLLTASFDDCVHSAFLCSYSDICLAAPFYG